jgi:2-isopropylmalate synthase
MWDAFSTEYLPDQPSVVLVSHELGSVPESDLLRITAQLDVDGGRVTIAGEGNGPIAAFVHGLQQQGYELDVVDYAEHATGTGADATAVAYVETVDGEGTPRWGVGVHQNIVTASLRAVVSALDRMRRAD